MNYYTLGLFSGIIVALIVLLITIFRQKDRAKQEFDERQKLMRGKASAAGMWTAMGGCAVVGLASVFDVSFCPIGIAMFLVIEVTVMVFVLVAIHYDAYFGFKANIKRQYTGLALFFVLMVMNVYTSAESNGFFSDGKMTVAWLHLTAAVMYAVLFAALFIHKRANREEKCEE